MDLLLLIIINVFSILWNKYTWSNLFFELCSRLCVKPKWRPRGPWSHSFGTYYVMKLSHLGILEKKTSLLKTKCSEPLQIPRNKWADGWNTTLNSICLSDLLPTLPLIDPPSRGQAWHWTHHWRALQSRRRSLKQQSSWKLSNEVIKSGKYALLEPLHELLSLSAGRTAPSHKTCVRHHHHALQEQKWPFELQQISWQLSHELELSAKSSPACSSVDCKHRVGPSLSCVPVWLQSGDYHH